MITKLSADQLRLHKGVSFVGVTTCFVCHDGNGEVLMSKRSQNARDEQGTWEVGGGGLKWGCTAEENIHREVKEEYGVAPLNVEFLGYRDILRKLPDNTLTHWLGLDFAVLVNREKVRNNEPLMIDDIDWFTLDHLPYPLHSQQQIAFEKHSKQLSRILSS